VPREGPVCAGRTARRQNRAHHGMGRGIGGATALRVTAERASIVLLDRRVEAAAKSVYLPTARYSELRIERRSTKPSRPRRRPVEASLVEQIHARYSLASPYKRDISDPNERRKCQ
jgi:NAD(P)-dependent dehydrogenase (short-subunit alcohol dehydrogenase family)